MFEIGKVYKSIEGKPVLIVGESREYGIQYGAVQGHDHIWRYDRPSDYGRTTGSKSGCKTNLTFVEVNLWQISILLKLTWWYLLYPSYKLKCFYYEYLYLSSLKYTWKKLKRNNYWIQFTLNVIWWQWFKLNSKFNKVFIK